MASNTNFKRIMKNGTSLGDSTRGNNIPVLVELIRKEKRKKQVKDNIRLFLTGFLQVFFVAINTYFITKQFFLGVLVVSFLISFIWSFNVRKVVFGKLIDRIIYSSGASIGGLVGLFLASHY